MIIIQPSHTADTRTCDYANTPKETLLASSVQHIGDVGQALAYFGSLIAAAAVRHDTDKLTDIDGFHADFVRGFDKAQGADAWWNRHRALNRHHLMQEDGIPADVDLIDVLDFIADCVMAGMARSGSVYDLKLPPELLERAFQGTVAKLKAQIAVERPGTYVAQQPVEAVSVAELCKSVVRGVLTCPQWLLDRINAGTLLVTETAVRLEMPNKLEGAAGWDDWIVRFADGTILPVRAEVFTALFGVQSRADHAP